MHDDSARLSTRAASGSKRATAALSYLVGALAAALISFGALAQNPEPPSANSEAPGPTVTDDGAAQDPLQSMQKAQQVQSELIEIQRLALEENPDLQKKGEELEGLIIERMKEHGSDPEQDLERLQQLQQQAQSPDVDETERQQMAQEFQQIQTELIRARQEAIQDDEVQQEQQQFQTAMLEAMQETNPRTEELLAEMREIQLDQERMIQEQEQLMRQQQQGQPQPGGPQPAQ